MRTVAYHCSIFTQQIDVGMDAMGKGVGGERLFCRFFLDVLAVWVRGIAAVVLDMAHGVFCTTFL